MKPIAILSTFLLSGCGWANLDDIKEKAPQVWKQAGFEVVGYEGFEYGAWIGGSYGGAHVWHTAKRDNVIFHGYIQRWGDEYHLYNIRALDAIRAPR